MITSVLLLLISKVAEVQVGGSLNLELNSVHLLEINNMHR